MLALASAVPNLDADFFGCALHQGSIVVTIVHVFSSAQARTWKIISSSLVVS